MEGFPIKDAKGVVLRKFQVGDEVDHTCRCMLEAPANVVFKYVLGPAIF